MSSVKLSRIEVRTFMRAWTLPRPYVFRWFEGTHIGFEVGMCPVNADEGLWSFSIDLDLPGAVADRLYALVQKFGLDRQGRS